ncbi:MAG: SAVED domain-containing protein [Lewinellaceae bacterium]|nr:SAVED domain-containing protein [Phaeodactylibacter sp.]MCB9352069.1 SAVED domain-containing protein [Lewinellaceae bacterium]
MSGRKNIKADVRLRLWVRSGGRCQFKGCNEVVYRNGLTLSDGNFSEVAHIIAASEDGPRGTADSEELQIDYDNLLLLCSRCHKEIDSLRKSGRYDARLLRGWKKEQEERIELATKYTGDIHKTTLASLQIKVGPRLVNISESLMKQAIFPRFPHKPDILIRNPDFDRNLGKPEFERQAASIKQAVEAAFLPQLSGWPIEHLSIFAIAPMPLLAFFGKCIGDIVPSEIYQAQRKIEDSLATWKWPEMLPKTIGIHFRKLASGSKEKVALVISLSDKIQSDKYQPFLDSGYTIYEISCSSPSQHLVSHPSHIEEFSKQYRSVLNEIQYLHGKDCAVNILPAMPLSLAIEAGRVLLPTKDPAIIMHEFYPKKGYREVLRIN